MKIGHVTSSVSRQGGGIYSALVGLNCGFNSNNIQLNIFGASDRFSKEDKELLKDANVELFKYWGPSSFRFMPKIITALEESKLDILHIHGLWMYPSLIGPKWSKRTKPYIISPHGMLDSWALNNSYYKKAIASFLFEKTNLRSARCIHALSEAECSSVRDYGLNNDVVVIPNGVDLCDFKSKTNNPEWALNLNKNDRVLLYLGRIHPKKGLEDLIYAWGNIKNAGDVNVRNWHLVIAGWDEGNHQTYLRNIAHSLGLLSSIHFVGPQFGNDKSMTLRRSSAFILPSLSEGLPMTVLEAWAHALPVLMTSQCNLPVGFTKGAAIKIQTNKYSIASAISTFINANEYSQRQMGERGRAIVAEDFSWELVAKEMISVYRWMLDGKDKPKCLRSI